MRHQCGLLGLLHRANDLIVKFGRIGWSTHHATFSIQFFCHFYPTKQRPQMSCFKRINHRADPVVGR